MLEARLQKHFADDGSGDRSGDVPGVSADLSVEFVAAAGFTIVFGASGAGKTTLLHCIAGIAHADSGRVVAAGKTLYDSDHGVCLAPEQRRVGLVFQDLALFPHLTAEQNVAST